MNDVLKDYRMMKINKSILCQSLGDDIHNAVVDHPLCIRNIDVSNAILSGLQICFIFWIKRQILLSASLKSLKHWMKMVLAFLMGK